MQKLRRFSACLVVTMVMLVTVGAKAQVLDQVPAEAMVVVKIKNIGGTSQKFSKFCQDLGVAAMVPQLSDPLGSALAELKLNNGVDKNGDFAFVFIDPSATGGDPEKSMMMLIPVTDHAEFMKNFPDAKGDGAVKEVAFGNDSHPSFVASWGKYAMLSPNKAVGDIKPTGLKAKGAAVAKELDSKDMVVYSNMERIKKVLKPELAKNRENILKEVEKGITQEAGAAKFAPAVKALVNQALNAADQFLSDADAATYSVNFAPDGIQTTLMAEFADGTYLGNLAKNAKNTDANLMVGLPAGKYLLYGGGSSDPVTSAKVFDDFLGPVIAELTKVEGAQSAGAVSGTTARASFSSGEL